MNHSFALEGPLVNELQIFLGPPRDTEPSLHCGKEAVVPLRCHSP